MSNGNKEKLYPSQVRPVFEHRKQEGFPSSHFIRRTLRERQCCEDSQKSRDITGRWYNPFSPWFQENAEDVWYVFS
jgi:hypothetical protein